MSYKKADNILPYSLLCAVQQYIDGEYIYIPRKTENRKVWGENTRTRQTLLVRNKKILEKRKEGSSVTDLADQFFLSEKTIYKIVRNAKT